MTMLYELENPEKKLEAIPWHHVGQWLSGADRVCRCPAFLHVGTLELVIVGIVTPG